MDKSRKLDSKLILGIDCGTAITGWAVIEVFYSGKAPRLVDLGTIETHKFTPEAERLLDLGESINQLLEEFNPDEAAVEDLFFFRNATTVIKVSQARGVVLFSLAKSKIPHYSYTPLQIKQQLTSYGRAKKEQIIYMMNKIFSLKGKLKQDDAADALAVAYTHYLLS
ncbi:MAG: crossover junction endodeoxyribonuclease RuvC [Candidatus Dojkabacteria bacterium]